MVHIDRIVKVYFSHDLKCMCKLSSILLHILSLHIKLKCLPFKLKYALVMVWLLTTNDLLKVELV